MSIYGKSRMINIDLLKTRTFLDLPTDSKLLYIFLICEADDDGIVNTEPILKYLNINIDALGILQLKGFILPLGNTKYKVDNSIFFITDFHLNNTIPTNMKKDSLYRPVLEEMYPEYSKVLVQPAHKERRINPNILIATNTEVEHEYEAITEINDESIKNDDEVVFNLELKKSCAKLNKTNINEIKLNHLHQEEIEEQEEISNTIDDEDEGLLDINKIFYGTYENVILTEQDIKIINTWKKPKKIVNLSSEAIKDSSRGYRTHFELVKMIAKENDLYTNEVYYFGQRRNLLLSNEDYSFFYEKYIDIDKNLKKVADRIVKKKIDNLHAYIEAIAQNEEWLEREEVEAAEAKKEQNRLKLEAEERALKEQEEQEYRMKLIDKYDLPINASEEMLKKAKEKEHQEVLSKIEKFINKKEII